MYTDRIVAFIDILGFKKMVESSNFISIYSVIKEKLQFPFRRTNAYVEN